jgi:hypothetical protein
LIGERSGNRSPEPDTRFPSFPFAPLVDTILLVPRLRTLIASALALPWVVNGCFREPAPARDINSKALIAKIPAIKQSVRQKDLSAAATLVQELDSEDPAVRFYAIYALHDLTGEDFGYKYYDDELERRAAVERWRDWLGEQRASGALQKD